RVTLDVMQPDHGTRRWRQSLERALEIDAGGHASHPESRSPLRVLLVQLLRVTELTPPDAHQRLRDGDLPYPPPHVYLATILLDAPHHLEERLLQHVLRVFGAARSEERRVGKGG